MHDIGETIRYYPVAIRGEIRHWAVRIPKEVEPDPELLKLLKEEANH